MTINLLMKTRPGWIRFSLASMKNQMTPMGIQIPESHLIQKKDRTPSSVQLSRVSALALGSCCPWRVQQTLCGEGRNMKKRGRQHRFGGFSNPRCCHMQSVTGRLLPSPSPGYRGLALSCLLFPDRLSQGNSPQFQPCPFFSPPSSAFSCPVALDPQLPLQGLQRGGTATKVTHPDTYQQGWCGLTLTFLRPPF